MRRSPGEWARIRSGGRTRKTVPACRAASKPKRAASPGNACAAAPSRGSRRLPAHSAERTTVSRSEWPQPKCSNGTRSRLPADLSYRSPFRAPHSVARSSQQSGKYVSRSSQSSSMRPALPIAATPGANNATCAKHGLKSQRSRGGGGGKRPTTGAGAFFRHRSLRRHGPRTGAIPRYRAGSGWACQWMLFGAPARARAPCIASPGRESSRMPRAAIMPGRSIPVA